MYGICQQELLLRKLCVVTLSVSIIISLETHLHKRGVDYTHINTCHLRTR